MTIQQSISSTCHYPSKYADIKGSRIHYIEQGMGDPILFLHGMPTSSYLWRNIIPALSDLGRCIAPDMIGMGQSDKPDIEYRVFDHIEYMEEFINKMKLSNITLIMHGWGSVIGFDIASRNEAKFKGLAFFEAHVRPTTHWNMLSLPVQQFASLLNRPGASYRAIVQQNYLINKLLPRSVMRKLSAEEMAAYQKPFPSPESRRPLWQYIKDLPLGTGPDDVVELMARYSTWLQQSPLPKLMFYAIPGFVTTMETVQWARQHIKNLQLIELQDVLHFAQESRPELFGEKLREWYQGCCAR